MRVRYSSQRRFVSKVQKDWKKRKFVPNGGNINLMKFAYRNAIFYANLRGEKVSKINRVETYPQLNL